MNRRVCFAPGCSGDHSKYPHDFHKSLADTEKELRRIAAYKANLEAAYRLYTMLAARYHVVDKPKAEPQPLQPMTTKQVAEALGCTPNHVWAMHTDGRLKGGYYLGRKLLFQVSAVVDFIDNGGTKDLPAATPTIKRKK